MLLKVWWNLNAILSRCLEGRVLICQSTGHQGRSHHSKSSNLERDRGFVIKLCTQPVPVNASYQKDFFRKDVESLVHEYLSSRTSLYLTKKIFLGEAASGLVWAWSQQKIAMAVIAHPLDGVCGGDSNGRCGVCRLFPLPQLLPQSSSPLRYPHT